jgi:site-specific recombinase XerD
MVDLDGITLVTEPSAEYLNQRQRLDYESVRKDCLSWLLVFGLKPKKGEGYAYQTVKARAYRMDAFYRHVWETTGGYTADVTHEHADAWMRELAEQDKTNAHKANCQKAVQMLFNWREHEHGLDPWDPTVRFSESSGASQPRDYLTRDERKQLREVALEHGSVPGYNDLSPEARDRWKAHLAQRFEKPKEEVTPADWDRANGWKIPTLLWVGLDAGLRPIEVKRAVVSWVDLQNGVLRIPKEESSKNTENWVVGLKDRTTEMLRRWINEREAYDKYDDTDTLWLTREENPYTSQSLGYLVKRLCEEAGIETDNRKLTWYSIRHSVGTYMTREEDLAAAQAQLRHKSEMTTMKYDQTPVEDRKDALDRMG